MTQVIEEARRLQERGEKLGMSITLKQILLSPEGALRNIEAEERFRQRPRGFVPSGQKVGFKKRGPQHPIRAR